MSENQNSDGKGVRLYVCLVLLATIGKVCFWIWSAPKQFQANNLVQAVSANDYAATKALLDKGANANGTNGGGTTPLMAAFASKNPNLHIAELLISKGANINVRGEEDGSTPLMLAADKSGTYGNADALNFLLKHGADINVSDNLDRNPLARAIETGQIAGVKAMLAAGAEPNDYTSLTGSPLARAARQGNTDIMQLLLDRGAVVNGRGSLGDTALTEAATYNRKNAVFLLLKHGANLNEPGEDKKTALQEASEKGNIEVVKLLIQAGARM